MQSELLGSSTNDHLLQHFNILSPRQKSFRAEIIWQITAYDKWGTTCFERSWGSHSNLLTASSNTIKKKFTFLQPFEAAMAEANSIMLFLSNKQRMVDISSRIYTQLLELE